MLAADGTACDSATDKLAGCTITTAIGAPAPYTVTPPTPPPTRWVTTYSGDCPGNGAGIPRTSQGMIASGANAPVCIITNRRR